MGSPLFPGPVLDKRGLTVVLIWPEPLRGLMPWAPRMHWSSFSAPKVLHLLRCSPSVDHSSLQAFDSMLRAAIQRITNSDLSDSQWLQASLPVKDGGLGVRRVTSLALPAFLASAASTLSLRSPFCQAALAPTYISSRIWQLGRQVMVHFQRHYLPNSPSGTDLPS